MYPNTAQQWQMSLTAVPITSTSTETDRKLYTLTPQYSAKLIRPMT